MNLEYTIKEQEQIAKSMKTMSLILQKRIDASMSCPRTPEEVKEQRCNDWRQEIATNNLIEAKAQFKVQRAIKDLQSSHKEATS